jgi:hypothetical protein
MITGALRTGKTFLRALLLVLLSLTARGGSISANICNLNTFLRYLHPNDDVNDDYGYILEH